MSALAQSCTSSLQESPGVTLQQLDTACPADLAGVLRRATTGEGGSIDASVKRVIIGKVCVGWHCGGAFVWDGGEVGVGVGVGGGSGRGLGRGRVRKMASHRREVCCGVLRQGRVAALTRQSSG